MRPGLGPRSEKTWERLHSGSPGNLFGAGGICYLVASPISGELPSLEEQTVTRRNSRGHSRGHSRNRTRFWILIAVGSIVAVCVLAILVDAAAYYNKIHTGVSVSGHNMGGLTRDEATAQLTGLVADSQKSGITLSSGGKTWTVMPADVGTKIDVAGAVSAAMDVSRESNFVVDIGRRFKLLFSDVDVPLNGTIDNTLMDKVLAGVAREIDVPAVNAGLAIDGTKIKVIEGQQGRVVDQQNLGKQLETLLLTLHTTDLTVPIVVVDPAVQADDNQAALDQAKTMISSPVVLKNRDKTWILSPEQIATYMDFASENRNGVSTLVPYLSAARLGPFFQTITGQVTSEPVSATFKSDGDKAWVVPGILGQTLDPAKTAEALSAAVLKTTDRTAEVGVMTTDPDLTTAEAEAMGIKDLLASYTTLPYAGTANRQVNVRITTEYASNVMLAPGEVYNFDKQIGPRTAARGYKLAKGIVGQGLMEDVLGGGICQVSTTLFNAVFEAGLEVVERWNHSIYIDHYPAGRDATVTAGGKNMRFKNDTQKYIWIRGTSDGVTTTFRIYGTDDGRTVKASFSGFSYGAGRTEVTVLNPSLGPGTTFVKISGQSGRQCTMVRTVKAADGTVIHKDTFKSYWPMIPKTIEVGPTTSTTSTTEPSTSTTGPPVTEF
jgi:vancomycin resistance protein YoaR